MVERSAEAADAGDVAADLAGSLCRGEATSLNHPPVI
jgi:hypothetical protein